MTDSPIDENEVQSHISRTRGSTISRANNSSKSDQNLDTSNSATSRAKNSNKNDQNLDTSISTRKITRWLKQTYLCNFDIMEEISCKLYQRRPLGWPFDVPTSKDSDYFKHQGHKP
ncbi:hypothetical protein AABB24_038480 [Solanum stoloniferum]|uniref:Late blight resistance protein n=1 Tax=Solanum stoloniferum TaxID=62892 RepID=A0ABD2QXT5_9SOLN